jgi:hypothetical protein
VLLNLVTNGARAMEGVGRIDVVIGAWDEACRIVVRDQWIAEHRASQSNGAMR